jgi:hypothetical protein
MIRTAWVLALVLVPGWAIAGKGGGSHSAGPGTAQIDAQIRALKAQIPKLRREEAARVKQIESQSRAHAGRIEKPEAREKQFRAQLEQQEKEALARIDRRYDPVLAHLKPGALTGQLQQTLVTLDLVRRTLRDADHDYGGLRVRTIRSMDAAEHSLKRAVNRQGLTVAEATRAVRDLQTAQVDLEKALAYEINRFGANPPRGNPEPQAIANRQLAEAIPVLQQTQLLLQHAHPGITDYAHEKREVQRKHEAERKQTREAFATRIHNIGRELRHQEQAAKDLERQAHDHARRIKEHYAAAIKQVEQKITQLEAEKKLLAHQGHGAGSGHGGHTGSGHQHGGGSHHKSGGGSHQKEKPAKDHKGGAKHAKD